MTGDEVEPLTREQIAAAMRDAPKVDGWYKLDLDAEERDYLLSLLSSDELLLPQLATALRWCVKHDGECLGDHPDMLRQAKAALKNAAPQATPSREVMESGLPDGSRGPAVAAPVTLPEEKPAPTPRCDALAKTLQGQSRIPWEVLARELEGKLALSATERRVEPIKPEVFELPDLDGPTPCTDALVNEKLGRVVALDPHYHWAQALISIATAMERLFWRERQSNHGLLSLLAKERAKTDTLPEGTRSDAVGDDYLLAVNILERVVTTDQTLGDDLVRAKLAIGRLFSVARSAIGYRRDVARYRWLKEKWSTNHGAHHVEWHFPIGCAEVYDFEPLVDKGMAADAARPAEEGESKP